MFVILPKVFGIVPAIMLLLNSRCRKDIKFSPKVEQIEVKLLALKTLEEKLIYGKPKRIHCGHLHSICETRYFSNIVVIEIPELKKLQ